jgi:hypothetical protein
VNDDSERLFCLNSVLRINADNAAAQRGAEMLRKQGVFPAVPVYPAPSRSTSVQDFTSKQGPTPNSARANSAATPWTQTESAPVAASASQQQPNYETDWKKQELSGYFQYAVMELASNKSRQAVEKLLVDRGASPEVAKTGVDDARYAVRKLRGEKYKKRMTRGLLWTVAGVVITCGTYAFASELGGKYYLFYGAIIFGFIDFVVGLIGWVANG